MNINDIEVSNMSILLGSMAVILAHLPARPLETIADNPDEVKQEVKDLVQRFKNIKEGASKIIKECDRILTWE